MTVRLGVDVGGTFTDAVRLGPDGTLAVRKVATTPADPAIGLFQATDALREPRAPGRAVAALVHGTTVATNALLERCGARVVLVATRGFEDLLWLRRQDRAALYDLARAHPPPLVARDDVVGVAERQGPDGVLLPLTDPETARVVAAVVARRPAAVAVALLYAFRDPDHERRLVDALEAALPGVPVAASHAVLPVVREFERTSTTTAEAYLRPLIATYLAGAAEQAKRRGIPVLRMMTSNGGSLPPAAAGRRAAALALSGPAAGLVGARLVAEALGARDVLTLDMGGTSADAGLLLDGTPLRRGPGSAGGGDAAAPAIAGIPIALPSLLLESVSAGGGSIAWRDEGGALKVGPESAGARPGPACYGRGGRNPTVTDACLVLGWLDSAQPLAAEVHLDARAAVAALETLTPGIRGGIGAVAAGITTVATATMARALKRVSLVRGIDPRQMALLVFGGAGPLFGCALADALGMERVIVPPHPGVLSAVGLAAAPEEVELVASVHRPLSTLSRAELGRRATALGARARAEVPGARCSYEADCRYAGQGYELAIPCPDPDPLALARAFRRAHRARYGAADLDRPIQLINLRVIARRPVAQPRLRAGLRGQKRPSGRRSVILGGRRVVATVWPLDELAPGVAISGPAILAGTDATGVIERGWRGHVHRSGALVLRRR